MKKNLVLLVILSGLLALTYWYEEIGGEKRLSKTKQAKALFQNKNLGNLQGIKFPKFDLILKEGKYFTKQSNYPVDKRKIEKIIEVLSSMEVISIIDKENIKTSRDNFFTQEDLKFAFQFERGEISYKLGAKLEVSSDFYVEVGYLEKIIWLWPGIPLLNMGFTKKNHLSGHPRNMIGSNLFWV